MSRKNTVYALLFAGLCAGLLWGSAGRMNSVAQGAPTNTPIPTITTNSQWTPQEQDFTGVTMALVPPGCFMMGSTTEQAEVAFTLCERDRGSGNCPHVWFELEQPIHEVCIDQPFWIDKTEVSNAQFATFKGKAQRASNWTAAEHPRDQINWFEARDFCTQRGGRLPTEAEWEYAARGPDSLIFPWGNKFAGDNVVYEGNSELKSGNVGSKPGGASWVGVLDMSGNVWEWVNTIFGVENFPYPYKANDGRESKDNRDNLRVMRGSSWRGSESYLRSASRGWDAPENGSDNVGVRCARDF